MSHLSDVLAEYEDEVLKTYYDRFVASSDTELYKKFLLSPPGRRRMRTYLRVIRLALEGDLESFLTDQRDASLSRAARGYELVGVLDSPLYLKRAVRDVIWRRYSDDGQMLGLLMSEMGQLDAILDQARTVIAGGYVGLRDEALTRHNEYLAGLSELSAAVGEGVGLASVLHAVGHVIARVTDAQHCVTLVSEEGEEPTAATARGASAGHGADSVDVRDARRMLARLSGPVSPVQDATARLPHGRRSSTGLRSYYAPLVIRSRVAGLIRVTLHRDATLPDDRLQLLVALANSVALLLENRWLNQRLAGAQPLRPGTAPTVGPAEEPTSLSERERQILQLVADGMTNVEIARRLVIEVNTVKSHLRRIFERLGARDRANAVFIAVRQGWLDVGAEPPPG